MKVIATLEHVVKKPMFGCQMCGQCVLHSTGMTCPMNCPKKMRNGPCGGVRLSGHCEVIPEMRCVWVEAWERGELMRRYADDLRLVQPPVNRALRGTSATALSSGGCPSRRTFQGSTFCASMMESPPWCASRNTTSGIFP